MRVFCFMRAYHSQGIAFSLLPPETVLKVDILRQILPMLRKGLSFIAVVVFVEVLRSTLSNTEHECSVLRRYGL